MTENWRERAVVELESLQHRIGKLHAFTNGPLFEELPADAQSRLLEQYKAMQHYAAILGRRITLD